MTCCLTVGFSDILDGMTNFVRFLNIFSVRNFTYVYLAFLCFYMFILGILHCSCIVLDFLKPTERASGISTTIAPKKVITTMSANKSLTGTSYLRASSLRSFGLFCSTVVTALAALTAVAPAANAITNNFATLVNFNSSTGDTPFYGQLVLDSSGNIYGTTSQGPGSNFGTIFEIPANTNTLNTLAVFNSKETTGSQPNASLLLDNSGNIYGTSWSGGIGNSGTIFKVAPGTGTINTLATFDSSTTGWEPNYGMVADSSGNLYGTTEAGGADSYGTVFKFNPTTGAITTLAVFNGANGSYPNGGLSIDRNGNLYGTTYSGGANNDGTVFEIAAGTSTLTTIVTFDGTNGANPQAGVTIDGNGYLYGTTIHGGTNNVGTVFEISGNGFYTVANFNGANGNRPTGNLQVKGDGCIFGVTSGGGAYSKGTVFEIIPGSGTITTLVSFDGTNGECPIGGVTLGQGSMIYGTTSMGGAYNQGTVWEIYQVF